MVVKKVDISPFNECSNDIEHVSLTTPRNSKKKDTQQSLSASLVEEIKSTKDLLEILSEINFRNESKREILVTDHEASCPDIDFDEILLGDHLNTKQQPKNIDTTLKHNFYGGQTKSAWDHNNDISLHKTCLKPTFNQQPFVHQPVININDEDKRHNHCFKSVSESKIKTTIQRKQAPVVFRRLINNGFMDVDENIQSFCLRSTSPFRKEKKKNQKLLIEDIETIDDPYPLARLKSQVYDKDSITPNAMDRIYTPARDASRLNTPMNDASRRSSANSNKSSQSYSNKENLDVTYSASSKRSAAISVALSIGFSRNENKVVPSDLTRKSTTENYRNSEHQDGFHSENTPEYIRQAVSADSFTVNENYLASEQQYVTIPSEDSTPEASYIADNTRMFESASPIANNYPIENHVEPINSNSLPSKIQNYKTSNFDHSSVQNNDKDILNEKITILTQNGIPKYHEMSSETNATGDFQREVNKPLIRRHDKPSEFRKRNSSINSIGRSPYSASSVSSYRLLSAKKDNTRPKSSMKNSSKSSRPGKSAASMNTPRKTATKSGERRSKKSGREKVSNIEKIRLLEEQEAERARKSLKYEEDEQLFLRKQKELLKEKENLADEEENAKTKVILAQRDFENKMKLFRLDEQKRRRIESEKRKKEKRLCDEEISNKKIELEGKSISDIKEIEELQEEIKRLESNQFKVEKQNRKSEKERRLKYEYDEKRLQEEEKTQEMNKKVALEEKRAKHVQELQTIQSNLKSVQLEKSRHDASREEDKKRIHVEIERLQHKEVLRKEADLLERKRLEDEEREAVKLAMIEIEAKKNETIKRRAHNMEMRKSLANNKRNQLITRPNTYSYFVNVPKKVWELPIGWQRRPKYKAGGIRLKI